MFHHVQHKDTLRIIREVTQILEKLWETKDRQMTRTPTWRSLSLMSCESNEVTFWSIQSWLFFEAQSLHITPFLLVASLTLKEAFSIPDTAERGITREQLAQVVRFISKMADRCCETFGEDRGTKLKFEDFNLYHADYWLIKPATQGYQDKGCSLVEVMAVEAQTPHWFVSHAWIEPWLCNLLRFKKRGTVPKKHGNRNMFPKNCGLQGWNTF